MWLKLTERRWEEITKTLDGILAAIVDQNLTIQVISSSFFTPFIAFFHNTHSFDNKGANFTNLWLAYVKGLERKVEAIEEQVRALGPNWRQLNPRIMPTFRKVSKDLKQPQREELMNHANWMCMAIIRLKTQTQNWAMSSHQWTLVRSSWIYHPMMMTPHKSRKKKMWLIMLVCKQECLLNLHPSNTKS